MKKILCLLLAISLAVSVAVIAPVTASAAETETAKVGAAEAETAEVGVAETAGSSVGTTSEVDTESISLGDERSFTITARSNTTPRLEYVAEKDMKIVFLISTYKNPEYGYPQGEMFDSGFNKTDYYTESWGDYEYGPSGFKIICDVTAGETYYFTLGFLFANGDLAYDVDEPADICVSLTEFSPFEHRGGTITGYDGTDTEIVIPSDIDGETITEIGYNAFYYSDIESVTIPNSVTSIGGCAFEYCSSLENVTIPDSVTSIGYRAFGSCSSLKSVTIPESVTSIEGSAFQSCSSLKSVTIPNSVTSIEYSTFGGCTSLESVTIPNSVTRIGGSSFMSCPSLKSITIPDSVSTIDNNAFGYYSNEYMDVVKVDGFTIYGYTGNASEYYANANEFNFVSLGETQNPMFPLKGTDGDCEWTLTEDGVLTISGSGEWGRAEDFMADYVREIIVEEDIKFIGSYSFADCKNLESVTINANISEIDFGTFMYCTSLKNVTLPDSLKSIEACAFFGCSSLKSITIPDSVNYIGDRALGYSWDEDWNNYSTIDGFTIYGYTGNAAEYYAKENGFEFVSLGESQNPATPDEATPDEATPDEATPDEATPDEATPDEATPDEPKGVGDANGDGVTDILDGALIQKYLVGKIEYPEEYLSWLDVNNDNAVDILDATDIQKFAAGIITEFNRRE